MRVFPIFASVLATVCGVCQPQELFRDTTASPEARAADIVRRLTLQEKIPQLAHDAPAIPRLGIPAYTWGNECLHGVMGHEATVFPQAIGMAASWDTDLMHRVADAISTEARALHHDAFRKGQTGYMQGLTYWSPNINIFRDPRWGRGQETYGEDPFLTGRMAVAFVTGLQGNDPKHLKLVSTVKHFAVHSGPDPLRHSFDATCDDRDLWDTYLPHFETAIREGGAWSVMGAYNRFRGVPCCANPFLLQEILRDRWGFRGYVVSDCGAIENIWQTHKVKPDAPAAAAAAVAAGCDVACVGDSYRQLEEAVRRGEITEEQIDVACRRLFEARIRLGMFDPPETVRWASIGTDVVCSAPHRQLSRQMARESLVLLKNQKQLLPLNASRLRRVAVIGPLADRPLLGNYSGSPRQPVTVYQGIRERLNGTATVDYDEGCPLVIGGLQPVPAQHLRPEQGTGKGLTARYYASETPEGDPEATVPVDPVDHDWVNSGPTALKGRSDHFSVVWRGTLLPPEDGDYLLGAAADDGVRLWVDGKKLVDSWIITPRSLRVGSVTLKANRPVSIELEYFEGEGQASVTLMWQRPSAPSSLSARAIELARQADVVVAVLGVCSHTELRGGQAEIVEDEGVDRAHIGLPAMQEKLLRALAATGKPVVLLLTGAGVSVPWADAHIPAIMQIWYPGDDGGHAVADVLFGDVSPAGRMPLTIMRSDNDLPPFTSYAMDDRTYRYSTRTPLYPFGYGLSYSRFRYQGLRIEPSRPVHGQPVTLKTTVINRGTRDADEVVQAYLSYPPVGQRVPVRKLVGFTRVNLKAGESREVALQISPRDFEYIDASGARAFTPGVYTITLGGSQGDRVSLRRGAAPVLRAKVQVQ